VVAGAGPGGTGIAAGTEVCALLTGGGYAQRVAVPAGQVLPIPAGVDVIDAASLPEVACTVWSNVVELAGLRAGHTLLVHGGGSGIGTFAIQLAAALGATVVTTARAAKHAALRELGAAVTVDYTEQDFVAATKEATGGRGADVILDIMGASYLARNIAALAPDGRLAIIGLQGGRRAELDLERCRPPAVPSAPPCCGPARRRTRHGSSGRYAKTCGRSSRRAPSGRSSTDAYRWPRRRRHTG
jgi:NADPH:quinone reductase-like Zn-dependent oxidoreductase